MDIKGLTVFLRTAELGSFTRAGAELGCSQSTVSFQIRQLEEELGVPLFERINRTVLLTDKGQEVLEYARKVIKMTRELESSVAGENRRAVTVRIAMADSLGSTLLGGGFSGFLADNPGIRLKLVSCGTEEMFRMLDRNEADAILTLENHIYNADYVVVREEQEAVHFAAAASSSLAGRRNLTLTELLKQPFILTEKGMSYRRLLDEQLAMRSAEITPMLEVGNPHLICDMVCQGAGVSFLPDFVTKKAVEEGRLVRLELSEIQVTIWKQLLHHRDKWISPQIRAVLKYCEEKAFS